MTSRFKEEERNEKAIRNLLKLPENRRCINCNSLGPQYVCTNFWTFVCTTCSGIHREFTHRVKSVSMAKFTSQEVSALQGGGNARAKEIYFKEWDPRRQSFPDSSNVERLRDFIKHVYVDRRYSGERNFDKPPIVKTAEAESSYQGGSRSPPFSDGRNSEDGKLSNGGFKVEGKSPDHQRDPDISSPPIIRPIRDIPREKASPIRIIEPPKSNGSRPSEGSLHTQALVRNADVDMLPTSVKIVIGDVGDPATLRDAIEGCNKIIYCATACSSITVDLNRVDHQGVYNLSKAFQDYNNKLAQLRAGKSSKSKLLLAKFKSVDSLNGWNVHKGTYFQDVVTAKYDGGMDAKFEFSESGDAVFSGKYAKGYYKFAEVVSKVNGIMKIACSLA